MMNDNRSKIVDIAERMVRSGGYNGFSFREIAAEIGIKSSSVHYHFATKEVLALEVARRYTENFLNALGIAAPEGRTSEEQIQHYCHIFQLAFEESGRACLCGMLSNEVALLPESVREAVVDFVNANIAWLEIALGQKVERESKKVAKLIYCGLEGAMGAAALTHDKSWIEDVSKFTVRAIFDSLS